LRANSALGLRRLVERAQHAVVLIDLEHKEELPQALVIDARAAGIGVAVVAAWRRAPLVAVIVLGAAVTALVRLAG